jgi:alpha-1,2-glucosyltransferase
MVHIRQDTQLWVHSVFALYAVHQIVNSGVTDVYMDEQFHVGQAQRYCEGDFSTSSWDDKITTFPGLYLWSYIFSGSCLRSLWGGFGCSLTILRRTNLIAAALLLIPIFRLRRTILPKESLEDRMLATGLAFFYPVGALYYFLYYTDTTSLLFVITLLDVFTSCVNEYTDARVSDTVEILQRQAGNSELNVKAKVKEKDSSKEQSKSKTNIVSNSKCQSNDTASTLPTKAVKWKVGWLRASSFFVLSVGAILMRQTNVVWVAFVGFTGAIKIYEKEQFIVALGKIERDKDEHKDDNKPSSYGSIIGFGSFLMKPSHIRILGPILLPLIFPCLLFAIFVYINGSIVLGDKSNHIVTIHPAMILHTFLFIVIAMGPISGISILFKNMNHLNPISWSLSFCFLIGGFIIFVAGVLYYGVQSHPFLLADNRHYTFYIWRYVLQFPLRRVVLTPIYIICIFIVIRGLQMTRQSPLWMMAMFGASALILLPSPLLEPRYFTPTAIITALHMPTPPKLTGFLSLLTVIMANALILYIFVYRSYTWDDGSVARFMF